MSQMSLTITQCLQQIAKREQNQNQFQVMHDLTKTISTFDGDRDLSMAGEWLDGVKTSALLYDWSESVKLETARTHRVGATKNWYIARRANILNWGDFEAQFKKTFVEALTTSDKWERMRKRIQRNGESVASYYHEKYKLCRDVGLKPNEIKEEILKALSSRT